MIRISLLFSLMIVTVSSATAADFYVGGRIGMSQFDGVASTDSGALGVLSSLPIDGLAFDSKETAFAINLGWQARDWLAVELGYTDLGNSGSSGPNSPVNSGPTTVQLINPNLDFFLLPPLTPGGVFLPGNAVFSVGGSAFSRSTSIRAKQWRLGTRFSTSLLTDLRAHWYIGLGRTSYDVEGTATFPVFDLGPPPSSSQLTVPNAAPGSEVDLVWGFGFDWKVKDSLVVDVAWRRHQSSVLDVDSLMLGMRWQFSLGQRMAKP